MRKKNLKHDVDLEERTEKQQRVIEAALDNPDLSQTEIARQEGVSSSTVSRVHRDYIDEMIPPDSVGPSDIDNELYERIVAGIKQGEDVTRVKQKHDLDLSQGGSKEVDVAVWLEGAGHEFLVDIECKFEEEPIEQTVVSALIRDVQNSVADKGVVISKKGFQEGALRQAHESNTELFTLKALERDDPKLEGRIMEVVIGVNVIRPQPILKEASFSLPNGDALDPEEERRVFSEDQRLYTLDGEPSGERLSDLAQPMIEQEESMRQIDVGDRLVADDEGGFLRLDSVTMEIDWQSSPYDRRKLSVYDDYDLYMKNELKDEEEEGIIEFYTIQEALSNLIEDDDPEN
jgi:hypothetical protein